MTVEVEQVISSYAVMLNRSQWLDPAKLDVQRAVWSRLLAGRSREDLTLADIEAAITTLAADPARRTADILPALIVSTAVDLAAGRISRVKSITRIFLAGGELLIPEEQQFQRWVDAGRRADGIVELDAAVAQIRQDLRSCTDDELVGRIVTALRDRRDEILAITSPSLRGC
jgi:hypothetical protein